MYAKQGKKIKDLLLDRESREFLRELEEQSSNVQQSEAVSSRLSELRDSFRNRNTSRSRR